MPVFPVRGSVVMLFLPAIMMARAAVIPDALLFGDPASETAHGFVDEGTSRIVAGAFGQKARRIVKPTPESWKSAPLRFRLAVDPAARTYFSVKFWGGDITHDHMMLCIDGRVVGQMHLGQYDLLDYEQCYPRDAKPDPVHDPLDLRRDPQYPGRFTTTTILVPENLTRGKDSCLFEIRAVGHVWGYGENFADFQKPVLQDSRAIYAAWTHPDPFARLPAKDLAVVRVEPPATPATNRINLAQVHATVEDGIHTCLRSGFLAGHPGEMAFLADAYFTPGCSACSNAAAICAIVAAVDDAALRFVREPDKVVVRGSWTGMGDAARAIVRLGPGPLASVLDELIADGRGGRVPRRKIWCDLFEASTRQLAAGRRRFSNQSQIVDTNLHACNRATDLLDNARGLPLGLTLRFLKESVGLLDWTCSVSPDSHDLGHPEHHFAPDPSTGRYELFNADGSHVPPSGVTMLTRRFLSKEDGYVGNYGESTIWAAANIYEATIDYATGRGDPELLRVMRNATVARTVFRYPTVRADGRHVMRLENVIGWRNEHFPGDPTYLSRNLDLRALVYTHDPLLLGCVNDAEQDGWFQSYINDLADPRGRDHDYIRLLHFPDDYAAIRAMRAESAAPRHMPMLRDEFVFTDPEDGVAAVKHGDDVLFVELFWRARGCINNLGKVHYVTPRSEAVATVHIDEEFLPTGKMIAQGDYFQYGWMGKCYREYRSPDFPPPPNALAGVEFPEGRNGGRAEFYHLSYGPYEIGLNDSRTNRTYTLTVPRGRYRVLPNGPDVTGGTSLPVRPHEGLVLVRQTR